MVALFFIGAGSDCRRLFRLPLARATRIQPGIGRQLCQGGGFFSGGEIGGRDSLVVPDVHAGNEPRYGLVVHAHQCGAAGF